MKMSVWSLARQQSAFQRYQSEKHLSEFYPQDGGESQLASKLRHCHPMYNLTGCGESTLENFVTLMATLFSEYEIRDAILKYNQKSTWVGLTYRTEPTTKKWKNRKTKKAKTGMLRSIGKHSSESMESVLKKKRKATVGRICRKGKF